MGNAKDVLHIYKRVSSSIQVEGTSLKTQEEIGIKLAEQLGMDFQVHNEGGKSSAHDDLTNRPIMLNLLKLMDKGVVKHIYVYNTDRLSRNQITWYTIRQKMVSNKVTLYTPKGVHNTEDSMENMILGILSEISQYDNRVRSERSRLGKFEKVKLNFWRGGDPAFGYRIEKGEGGNRLQIEPEESRWVQFIYDEYNKRTSMKSIKSLLELNQVKTRRGNTTWTLGTLQLMLRNELYTGVDVFYDKKIKQTITNSVPVIIPLKVFNAAKERRLKILERKGQMNRTKKFYLLRDFMICGSCKTPMGGRIKKVRCEQMYYCPLSERKFNSSILDNKVCTMKRGLNIPSTDKEVWDVITKVISNTTEIKNRFISDALLGSGLSSKEIKAYKKECSHKLDELNNEKKQVEGAIIKIETKFALGEFASQEVYDGIKKDLNTKYKAVKIKIETINGEIGQLGNQQQWLDWIDDFGADILSAKDLTDEEKKGIINAVVRDILVNYDQAEKRHHLRINFRLPVLSTLGGILKENDAVLKRGKNAVKISESAESIDNTGAPKHHRSELLHRY